MKDGAWIFEGLGWVWSLLLLVAGAMSLAIWYLDSLRVRPAFQRWLLLVLRWGAWAGVLWICAMPALQVRQMEAVPPRIAILLDGSSSMDREEAGDLTRHELARSKLDPLSVPSVQLERFSFASLLSRGFDGRGGGSNLHSALAQLVERQKDSGLKAVVLISDGRPTDAARSAAGLPLFSIPLGPRQADSVQIEVQPLPTEVEPGATLNIEGTLGRDAVSGPAEAKVAIWRKDGQIREELVRFEPGSETARFSLRLQALGEGIDALRLQVVGGEGRPGSSAYLATQVRQARTRLLLLCESAGFECAFLGRQLEHEDGLELVRGVGLPDDRIWLDGEVVSSSSLPDLAPFSAVLLVGSRAEHWLEGRIEPFVKRGGGVFWVLGEWGDLPSQAMWPWQEAPDQVKEGAFEATVSSENQRHPLLVDLNELQSGSALIPSLPPLAWVWSGGAWKAASETLLEAKVEGRLNPLLVIQRYGQGRVGVWTGGPIWSWRFQTVDLGEGKEELYIRLLPRLARWAASQGEFDRFSLKVLGRSVGEPIHIQVAALKEDSTPDEGRQVRLRIFALGQSAQEPDRQLLERTLVISAGGGTQWDPVLEKPGAYRVEAEFLGDAPAQRQAAIALNWPSGEMLHSTADWAFLERLARESGGRLLQLDQLPALLEELGAQSTFRFVVEKQPLWSQAGLLGLVLSVLILEWALRRLWRLP